MIVAFIGKVLTGKIKRENFDESLAVHQNSSDFSTVKVLHYMVDSYGTAQMQRYTREHPTRVSSLKAREQTLRVCELFNFTRNGFARHETLPCLGEPS